MFDGGAFARDVGGAFGGLDGGGGGGNTVFESTGDHTGSGGATSVAVAAALVLSRPSIDVGALTSLSLHGSSRLIWTRREYGGIFAGVGGGAGSWEPLAVEESVVCVRVETVHGSGGGEGAGNTVLLPAAWY